MILLCCTSSFIFVRICCPEAALLNGGNRRSLSGSYEEVFKNWQPAFYFQMDISSIEIFICTRFEIDFKVKLTVSLETAVNI